MNLFLSQTDPTVQRLVIRKCIQNCLIGDSQIGRITRQNHPAERTFSFTEKRTDVLWDKSRNPERFFNTCLNRLSPDIVSVIHSFGSSLLHIQHGRNMNPHRSDGSQFITFRIFFP